MRGMIPCKWQKSLQDLIVRDWIGLIIGGYRVELENGDEVKGHAVGSDEWDIG